ncbi:LAME_0A00210g1_1 [Lachancea meyersii CBS 8951]|uniref:LAME_0A00210g1_1 n=1 Tax=Lachancea meyersii CBS 8951 TaxID=1266667 RepID=A0A1G4ILH0_9SACH|nr:LAME_0A00210g1_1 [Lachancea meyersii CBS 8951]
MGNIFEKQSDDHVSRYILKHRDVVLKRNFDLCKQNLILMKDFIEASNGKFSFVYAPKGGSACLLRLADIEDTESFSRKPATEYKVLCKPGECFGIPGTLRIGFGTPRMNSWQALRFWNWHTTKQ